MQFETKTLNFITDDKTPYLTHDSFYPIEENDTESSKEIKQWYLTYLNLLSQGYSPDFLITELLNITPPCQGLKCSDEERNQIKKNRAFVYTKTKFFEK